MHRLLVFLIVLVAALAASPAVALAEPDPATCTGYAEQRVAKESQSWWSQGAGKANPQPGDSLNGRDEHAHMRVCVPYNIPVSGVVRFDLDMQIHEMPGGVIRRTRIQDRDNTLYQADLVEATRELCAGGNCHYIHTVLLNTDTLAAGKHEFRFHNEIQRPDGARALATNGWHICIRACTPNVVQAVTPPEEEGRSRWFEADGTDYGYNNARLRSALPYANGQYTKLAGQWCPTIRTLTGAGGRPVVRSFVSIDPRFHDYSVPEYPDGWPGMVIVDEPNSINRQVCIDTTKLANGRHKLYMRGDGQAATGKQGGVYVVEFETDNGVFEPPMPDPTPSPDPTPTPDPCPVVTLFDPAEGEVDPSPVTFNARATGATRMDYYVDEQHVGFDDTAANGFDESIAVAPGTHVAKARATVEGGVGCDSAPVTFSS